MRKFDCRISHDKEKLRVPSIILYFLLRSIEDSICSLLNAIRLILVVPILKSSLLASKANDSFSYFLWIARRFLNLWYFKGLILNFLEWRNQDSNLFKLQFFVNLPQWFLVCSFFVIRYLNDRNLHINQIIDRICSWFLDIDF